MPTPKAASVGLSAEHEQTLRALIRAHSTPQKLAERARIVLLAAEGASSGIAERLSDAPRSGAPATFTPEQICQIMAMACEDPERLDVPISHWSQSELARQAVRRGIVESISHGSVGRFLKMCRPPAAS